RFVLYFKIERTPVEELYGYGRITRSPSRRNHLHPESERHLRHRLSDFPETNDSKCLPAKLDSARITLLQFLESRIAFKRHVAVRIVQKPRAGKQMRKLGRAHV